MAQEKATVQIISDLMSALRGLMTKEISAEQRLKSVLVLLCEQLNMPTAIFYVARPGDVLERLEMVGKDLKMPIFVRVGETLVGEAALQHKTQLICLKTGSRKTNLAVPVLRKNELVGVLQLVSHKVCQLNTEVVEAVQNVAMVLAGFLSELSVADKTEAFSALPIFKTFEGQGLVKGFALGEVLLHRRLKMTGPILAANTDKELKKLNEAFSKVQTLIKRRLSRQSVPPEEKELFETYLLFLHDTEWKAKIMAAVSSGLTAAAALQKVADETLDKMRAVPDSYLRERAHDFQDLTARLMKALLNKAIKKKVVGNKILVADSLGAAELLDYDLKHIKGIVLEDASQTTHVVIVARAYRIPLIGGVKQAVRSLEEAAPVALNAVRGKVYLSPSEEVLDSLRAAKKALADMERTWARNQDKPAQTKDGIDVSLRLNLGISGGMEKLPPCDGVGLFRTELLFMTAKSLPDIKTQTESYKRVVMLAKGKPVVFRTLDIGSDKVLPYFEQQTEENPALGWRSIRMTLDRRALLRYQLRALIRANAGGILRVMFPMITDIAEFIEAKRTLQIELKNAVQRKEKVPEKIEVGTMLEVPALIFQLENILPMVDFISIGTNDLAQFIFAADRGNPQIATRYDVLSPAFLKMLRHVVQLCEKHQVPCSVCGEMASRPLEAIALMGLGVRVLSMSPEALGPVKAAVRTTYLKRFQGYLLSLLNSKQTSLRSALFSYLRDHDVQLGEMR